MNTSSKNNLWRRYSAVLFCVVVSGFATGCQTFSLTADEFSRQQRDEAADPETGEVVAVVGTAGFLGAMIGFAAACAGKR